MVGVIIAMSPSRRQFLITLALAGAMPVLVRPAVADSGAAGSGAGFAFTPPAGSYIYMVTRNGERIGTQTLEYLRQGEDGLTVITDVEIDVHMLGFSVYTFTQHIEEHWRGGILEALYSQTDDDGEQRQVDLRRDGDRLKGRYNAKERDVPANLITSTLWHPDAVRQSVVLDTVRGRTRAVSVADKGVVSVRLPFGAAEARYFSFTGELNRDVWYDTAGVILAAEMKGKDGSVIRQELLARP
jgi:hypothetical protein